MCDGAWLPASPSALCSRTSFYITSHFLCITSPNAGYLGAWYDPLWHRVVPWVGVHVLHLSYAVKVLPNGSGDTTFNYVQVLCYLILAVVATAIWSVLDRKRTSYEKVYSWLKLYVRLVLGAALISYGATKLIPV